VNSRRQRKRVVIPAHNLTKKGPEEERTFAHGKKRIASQVAASQGGDTARKQEKIMGKNQRGEGEMIETSIRKIHVGGVDEIYR